MDDLQEHRQAISLPAKQYAINLLTLLYIRLNTISPEIKAGQHVTDLSVPMKAGKSLE